MPGSEIHYFATCKRGETTQKTGCTPVGEGTRKGAPNQKVSSYDPTKHTGGYKATTGRINSTLQQVYDRWHDVEENVLSQVGGSSNSARAAVMISTLDKMPLPEIDEDSMSALVRWSIGKPIADIKLVKKIVQKEKHELDQDKGGCKPPEERKQKFSFLGEWTEGKHPRENTGKFAPKEGPKEGDEGGEEEKEKSGKKNGEKKEVKKDTDESGEEKKEETSKIKSAGKAIWKAINAWPTVAQAVVKETGVSPRVAKAAYVVSMAGDYAVPGLPVGSAAVIVAATIKNPVAPIRAVKKAIQQAREKLSKGKGGAMGANKSDSKRLMYVAKLIDSKENKELYIKLLATATDRKK